MKEQEKVHAKKLNLIRKERKYLDFLTCQTGRRKVDNQSNHIYCQLKLNKFLNVYVNGTSPFRHSNNCGEVIIQDYDISTLFCHLKIANKFYDINCQVSRFENENNLSTRTRTGARMQKQQSQLVRASNQWESIIRLFHTANTPKVTQVGGEASGPPNGRRRILMF